MKNILKNNKWGLLVFWLVTGFLLGGYLQKNYTYVFPYKEQSQLFLLGIDFFKERCIVPGGLSAWFSEFLVQFFIYENVGVLITTVLLLIAAVSIGKIITNITHDVSFSILGWLPVLTSCWPLINENAYFQGTFVFVLISILAAGCSCIRTEKRRLFTELFIALFSPFLLGAGAFLFAVWTFLFELIKLRNHKWMSVIPLCCTLIISGSLLYTCQIHEARLAFMPDAYFPEQIHPKLVAYYPWLLFLLVTFIPFYSRVQKGQPSIRRRVLRTFIQLSIIIGWGYWGFYRFGNANMVRYMELDYYSRTEQWDRIQSKCKGPLDNPLYMNVLARSLAEQGKLTDELMNYDIRGPQGLAMNWNRVSDLSVLLSDIYFTAGNIALSQRFAVEANANSRGNIQVRMLQRLIQTNLIYGTYEVAEKYIRLLENTLTYRDWAKNYRKFLYDDKEVEKDPLLGGKRLLLLSPKDTSNCMVKGTELWTSMDLPLKANPQKASTAFQYLVASYLLQKNVVSAISLIDRYINTPLLPSLPVLYQEVLVVSFDNQPNILDKYPVEPGIKNKYARFKNLLRANRGSRALPEIVGKSYANTYWYYLMFK